MKLSSDDTVKQDVCAEIGRELASVATESAVATATGGVSEFPLKKKKKKQPKSALNELETTVAGLRQENEVAAAEVAKMKDGDGPESPHFYSQNERGFVVQPEPPVKTKITSPSFSSSPSKDKPSASRFFPPKEAEKPKSAVPPAPAAAEPAAAKKEAAPTSEVPKTTKAPKITEARPDATDQSGVVEGAAGAISSMIESYAGPGQEVSVAVALMALVAGGWFLLRRK